MNLKESIGIARRLRPDAELCWNCAHALWTRLLSGNVLGMCKNLSMFDRHERIITIDKTGKLFLAGKQLNKCFDFSKRYNND